MHKENWDDLRYVLAVAETGSVSGAARELGVNHATVLRHVASFEERHGVELFEKTAKGYAIPVERLRVIDAAREVETAVLAVERLIKGAAAPLRGVVRVTSTDSLSTLVLPRALARLRDRTGELRLELLSTNAHVDFGRLHADVTVRPAERLSDELSGTAPARLAFGHYARPDLGPDAPWLGLAGVLSRSMAADWVETSGLPKAQVGGDSFLILAALAAEGLGQAILPCLVGDADPRLKRRHGTFPEIVVPIWVASHVDMADVPRIRAARALLADSIAEDAAALAGRS